MSTLFSDKNDFSGISGVFDVSIIPFLKFKRLFNPLIESVNEQLYIYSFQLESKFQGSFTKVSKPLFIYLSFSFIYIYGPCCILFVSSEQLSFYYETIHFKISNLKTIRYFLFIMTF